MIDFKEELQKFKPIIGADDIDMIINPTVYLDEVKDILDLLKEIVPKQSDKE